MKISVSSQTCPTCRAVTRSRSLIKLFFETDDNNRSILNLEDILKTNDDLTKRIRELEEKSTKQEADHLKSIAESRELKDKVKNLERENSTKSANIEGLRGLREELSLQVLKHQEIKNTLRFDLLAERQLRRDLQNKLHELLPNDENYKIDSITDEQLLTNKGGIQNGEGPSSETPSSTSAILNDLPSFRRLRCEIEFKPKEGKAKNDNQKSHYGVYSLPNKLIRGTNLRHDAKLPKNFIRKPVLKNSLFNTDKPKPFQFPSSFDRASPQPSTSNGITESTSTSTVKNIFGSNNPSVTERDFKDLSTISISSSPNIFLPNMSNDPSLLDLSTPLSTRVGSFHFSAYRTSSDSSRSFQSSPTTSSPFAITPSGATGINGGPKESER